MCPKHLKAERNSLIISNSTGRKKSGVIFLSLITLQESKEIMYLTNALGNEEDRGFDVEGQKPNLPPL